MQETETNFAVYFMAGINIICATISFLFFFKTYRKLIELTYIDSIMLCLLTYSFSHIMLATMVPDHFCLSLCLLSLTIYIAGKYQKQKKFLPLWKSALLFFLTAGITTTNGIKTCLAVWFTNGKKTFSISSVCALTIAALALYGIWYHDENTTMKDQKIVMTKIEKAKIKKDSTFITKQKAREKFVKQQNGTTISEDAPILKWTDISTSRWQSIKENLFGESIQLHQKHTLKDVQQNRPIFVEYDKPYNYITEAIMFLLFLTGIWCGREKRLMWMVLSWATFDMLMHIGFGFGINEVYIMAAHWAFVIPLCYAYIIKYAKKSWTPYIRGTIFIITTYLYIYNISLIAGTLYK